MVSLEIRPVTAKEFQTAIDWAANEGWNPGIDDLATFHAADPQGFLMGFINGTPISSISVVRYGADYGFLGFYIVRPDHRGSGVGIETWNAGIDHLEGRTIGLDGVVDQQDNYTKSGFKFAGRNVRYSGRPQLDPTFQSPIEIRSVSHSDLSKLCLYDQKFFPTNRDAFTRSWATPQNGAQRTAKIAVKDGQIVGYGVRRACLSGYKIGPLFAEDKPTAHALLYELCLPLQDHEEISLDTPEDNVNAVQLAKQFGLNPVFETARMYKGDAPVLKLEHIFGITTFELG